MLAAALGTELIRLQCYEGLDVSHARVRVELRASAPGDPAAGGQPATRSRPRPRRALQRGVPDQASAAAGALERGDRPPVLLIDEIDRADEEFEGYLLELLSDFQVTIPELGTIRAAAPPVVIITSNRTREMHDALKRRCLYPGSTIRTSTRSCAIVTPEGAGRARAACRAGDGVRAGAAARPTSTRRPACRRRSTGWPRWSRSIRTSSTPTVVEAHARHPAEEPGRHRVDAGRAGCRARHPRQRPGGFEDAMMQLAANMVLFVRTLRSQGVSVRAGGTLDAVRALEHVGLQRRDDVRDALRTVLVTGRHDLARFDRVFDRSGASGRPRVARVCPSRSSRRAVA